MGRSHLDRAGFKLSEIVVVLILLGILAALVIPQFSSAAQASRETALRDAIQYMRTQVTVFKSEHRGVCPGYPDGKVAGAPDSSTFVRQMTNYSDELCATSSTASPRFHFGPYFGRVPMDAINERDGVRVVTGASMPSPDESQHYGWIYNATTSEISANLQGYDLDGKPYQNY